MRRRPKRSTTVNKKAVEASDNLIRQNSATVYGLYFASSNTDFLLDEKKTRFSLRPSVVVKPDRQTVMFDYSQVTGDEASIFDGFFRGISAGATLTLDGGIESTCNFINEVTGVPLTNFADTYTISTVDVSKKILVATKGTSISSTTASVFDGRYFIDLPQWTKTQTNEDSTTISKILNLLPSQSISHLGVMPGSVLEFAKTSKNNSRFTVENIYTQNGIECIDVTEQVVQEDASDNQVIVSVYGEESVIERGFPPLFPAPTPVRPIYNWPDDGTWPRINTCCPCMSCLIGCIRQAESGRGYDTDPVLDPGEFPGSYPGGPGQIPDDSILRGCNPPCTDGGTDCGPYQIDEANFIQDVCDAGGPCSNGDGGYDGPLGDNDCCEICQSDFGMQDYVCPGNGYPDTNAGKLACCQEKDRRARLLIDCYQRRWTRNNPCLGNGDTPNPIDPGAGNCYLCEDIGRMHQGGQCGHRNPSDFNDGYWAKVKKCMETNCSYRKRDNGDGTFTESCQDPIRTPDYGYPGPQYPDPRNVPGFFPTGPDTTPYDPTPR